MDTYMEPVRRYRVLCHTEYPEAHKAEIRITGRNPDDIWSLVYSTNDAGNAEEFAFEMRERGISYETWKVVDGYHETVIERFLSFI